MISKPYKKFKGVKQSGFTLIELIVVIVLLGLMFSFALPKMDGFLFSSGTDKVSRWVILNVLNLKRKAVKEQIRYSLNVDIPENSFFISIDGMDEIALAEARENGYKLGDNVKIIDVVFPFESPDEEKITNIFFYTKGYSDNAIIHIENRDGEKFSFVIEPFLPGVEIKEELVEFDI